MMGIFNFFLKEEDRQRMKVVIGICSGKRDLVLFGFLLLGEWMLFWWVGMFFLSCYGDFRIQLEGEIIVFGRVNLVVKFFYVFLGVFVFLKFLRLELMVFFLGLVLEGLILGLMGFIYYFGINDFKSFLLFKQK